MTKRHLTGKTKKNPLSSEHCEKIFFTGLLATLTIAIVFHWVLDLSYKYVHNEKILVDYNWIFFICGFIAIYYLLRKIIIFKRPVEFDVPFIVFVLSMIVISVIDSIRGDYSNTSYTWIMPMAYIIGKIITDSSDDENRIEITCLVLVGACFFITALDFVNFYRYSSDLDAVLTEGWPEMLTGQWSNRCTMSFGLVPVLSCLGYVIIAYRKKAQVLIPILFANIFVTFWALTTESKTIIVLQIISLLSCAVIYYIDSSVGQKRYIVYIAMLLMIFVGLITAILLACNDRSSQYLLNNSFLRTYMMRLIRDVNSFKLLINNPLGYPTQDYWFSPHSMMLSYGQIYGLFVYVLLSLFRILLFVDAIKLLLFRPEKKLIKYLLIPEFLCINIFYSLEVNVASQRYYWMLGIFISGMIRGWLEKRKPMNA